MANDNGQTGGRTGSLGFELKLWEAADLLRNNMDPEVNLAQSRTLAALRDTLLPKLISGELRVPEAEALVAEVA